MCDVMNIAWNKKEKANEPTMMNEEMETVMKIQIGIERKKIERT